MRGKRRRQSTRPVELRIIPASAGQTAATTGRSTSTTDHPRECGANNERRKTFGISHGSSPRVRGKLRRFCRIVDGGRIIPASAGQTNGVMVTCTWAEDHPRECGANDQYLHQNNRISGSSPRVRGKQVIPYIHLAQRRIIPASAGQTHGSTAGRRRNKDHPRECGANSRFRKSLRILDGSSPRVRGKPSHLPAVTVNDRIIPASAGQTGRRCGMRSSRSDHPRECGANVAVGGDRAHAHGSSPRVRGKPHPAVRHRVQRRIIPASAGQTDRRAKQFSLGADHPRECGANVNQMRAEDACHGSSPRVRGKRIRVRSGTGSGRIIPASAGQT